MVRFLGHRVPKSVESSTAHNFSKATLVLLKKEKKKKPEGETPALVAFESY